MSTFGFKQSLVDYDFKAEQEGGDFEPLPAGKYGATIVEAEIKATKAGNGRMLALTYDIDDTGGRRVWDYLLFEHPKEQVANIGRNSINAIAAATGFAETPAQPEELIARKLCVELKVEQGTNGYGPSNRAFRYYKYGEQMDKKTAAKHLPSEQSQDWPDDEIPF